MLISAVCVCAVQTSKQQTGDQALAGGAIESCKTATIWPKRWGRPTVGDSSCCRRRRCRRRLAAAASFEAAATDCVNQCCLSLVLTASAARPCPSFPARAALQPAAPANPRHRAGQMTEAPARSCLQPRARRSVLVCPSPLSSGSSLTRLQLPFSALREPSTWRSTPPQ